MTIYLILIAFILLTYPIYEFNSKIYLFINNLIIFLVMACRNYTVGDDTISYRSFFGNAKVTALPQNFLNWLFPLHNQRFETGFVIYNKILYAISDNFQIVMITTAFIIIICFSFFLVKLNCNYPLSLLIFLCLNFMANSMNLMRQSLAWAFTMVAFVFAVKRKFWPFFLFVIIAGSMHVTGWLFLIVYPLTKMKLNTKNVVLLLSSGLVIFFAFESIFNQVASMSDEANTFSLVVGQQTNKSNLIVNILIFAIIIGFSYYTFRINDVNDQVSMENRLSILMILIAISVTIISFKFSQLFRVVMYFSSGEFVLIPYILKHVRPSLLRMITYLTVILLLIGYFVIVQRYRPDWSGIVPYSFIQED